VEKNPNIGKEAFQDGNQEEGSQESRPEEGSAQESSQKSSSQESSSEKGSSEKGSEEAGPQEAAQAARAAGNPSTDHTEFRIDHVGKADWAGPRPAHARSADFVLADGGFREASPPGA